MPDEPEQEPEPVTAERAHEPAEGPQSEAESVLQADPEAATTPEFAADEVLLASAAIAQRALLEMTAPETVGSVIGHVVEGEHVLTLLFAADVPGYRGWHWAVTIARVEGAEPTVLETELMPGDGALLAPEWVPWSDRLAEYRAAQAAAAAEAAANGSDASDESGDDETDASGSELDDDEFGDDEDELDDDVELDDDELDDDLDDDELGDDDDDDDDDSDEDRDDEDEFGDDDEFDDDIDVEGSDEDGDTDGDQGAGERADEAR
jgi:hypothetical protein